MNLCKIQKMQDLEVNFAKRLEKTEKIVYNRRNNKILSYENAILS